jgi:hydroxyquinol 1,2-dioxygenase
MIIKDQKDVTRAVLSELERAKNPRFKEIMSAAVRHLHEFIREARLTEEEFHQTCAIIARLGQKTNANHNEVVLGAGSLGVSTLICLLNNGNKGQTDTTANLLGPFWRLDSPRTENGGSIVRSPTPGPELFVNAWVKDTNGNPVPGAEVDIWQSSPEGFYENQDPGQAEMNLRGKFTTDKDGHLSFRSVKPAGYPIPVDGPVGDLIRVQGRHNMRPAHLHFLIYKPGFKTHISQVYVNDDKNLETDVQFGVTEALVGNYVRHDNDKAPAPDVKGPWYSLDYTFVMETGEAKLPRPPITAKAEGERPNLEVLERV